MKLNRLETHDRLEHFKKDQAINIFQGAEDCLKKNPLSLAIQEKSPYVYIFAHPRTHEDGVTKVMYWQPRLTIPEAQTNSYLFRAISKTDMMEICWMIPPRETWPQYKKGNITENETVLWSIGLFEHDRARLTKPNLQDLPEEQSRHILQNVILEHREQLRIKKMYPMQETSEVFLQNVSE